MWSVCGAQTERERESNGHEAGRRTYTGEVNQKENLNETPKDSPQIALLGELG